MRLVGVGEWGLNETAAPQARVTALRSAHLLWTSVTAPDGVAALTAAGYQVFAINPLAVTRYRDCHHVPARTRRGH
jgi:hypothetical protein